MGEPEWVSVSEAARRLGVTRQAIRGRIARKTIPFQTDNHGHPLVQAVNSVPGTVSDATERNVPFRPAAERSGLVSLEDVRIMLGEQRAHHDAAIALLRADHEAERLQHTRDRRADHVLSVLVIAAGVAVLAIAGPWWRGW